MTFGQRLKQLRIESNISQAVLAEAIEVSSGVIAEYELGKRTPKSGNLVKLAKHFNVSLDYLMCLSDHRDGGTDLIEFIQRRRPHLKGKPLTDEQITFITGVMEHMLLMLRSKN